MRVSEYFKLGRDQPYLDFVDVRLDTDLAVFVDPGRLRGIPSTWATECIFLLQDYFDRVLGLIARGKDDQAVGLLSRLNESNDFHFGFSKGRSRGRGMGRSSAKDVWAALTKSKAGKTGLLQDLEDTCLLIDRIGPDMISDAVCNIIRGPLIQYTQHTCNYYEVQLTPDVDSGPIWNPDSKKWEHTLVSLPMTEYGRLVLVPKILVRHQISYDPYEYYQHYLLPHMQREEIRLNTGLVKTLKDGRKRVTKKSLKQRYGADKSAAVEQTIKHPSVLNEYKAIKKKSIPSPINHERLAEIESTKLPDFATLLNRLKAVPYGRAHASEYENCIESLLTALFYPSLTLPIKQHEIHEGRKRIDITYVNSGLTGFFGWLAMHYSSAHIFIECKNYGADVGNPEIDQLSGRFSPSRGKVGLLICRKIEDRKRLLKRCADTARDDRGFIMPLDDEDLEKLVNEYLVGTDTEVFSNLRKVFNQLIM